MEKAIKRVKKTTTLMEADTAFDMSEEAVQLRNCWGWEDTMEAATRVIGSPFIHSGDGQFSILERTPAKRTIAKRKPSPTPREENIDSIKL